MDNTLFTIDFVKRFRESTKIHYQLSPEELHNITIQTNQG
jgi:hypothetical protein